jgi:hypothetical protein
LAWSVARSLDVLRDEINKSAPKRSKASDGALGDAQHKLRQSDHNPCVGHEAVCARDITHDPKGGFDSYVFADWLRARCASGAENRVKYIISNRRIASAPGWAWRKYSGGNPHDKHVHISVNHGPEVYGSARSWGWGQKPTTPSKPTTPTTPPAKGFLMALTDQQQKDLYDRVMGSLPGTYSTEQRAKDPPPEGRLFVMDNMDGHYLVSMMQQLVAEVQALRAEIK